MSKKNFKKAKQIAKIVGKTAGGAALEGTSALIDVALAPLYVGRRAVVGGVNGYLEARHKPTLDKIIEKKLEKMK